ncbi:MAG: hypothetical protein SOZ28_02965 [Clostridia bacterium]|nr:hypothetical protein [Clostridia bacterium]
MVDVNKIVREILETIDGVTVTFYHPDKFNNLPVISYYELTTTTGMCFDNEEQAQSSGVEIDIWGKGGGECSRLAIKVDKAMQNDGWYRELSRDMPPENNIFHKTMRFSKEIFKEE